MHGRKSKVTNPLRTRCIRLGGRTRPLIVLELFRYAMRRIVPVNLRALEMREVGWNLRARASRGNTETSTDFGCLNITFLVSFVLLRPVHKQAPYPKARRCTVRKRCYGTSQLAPGESREILLYI